MSPTGKINNMNLANIIVSIQLHSKSPERQLKKVMWCLRHGILHNPRYDNHICIHKPLLVNKKCRPEGRHVTFEPETGSV